MVLVMEMVGIGMVVTLQHCPSSLCFVGDKLASVSLSPSSVLLDVLHKYVNVVKMNETCCVMM